MLINTLNVDVDYNGIVFFDPLRLEKYFDRKIEEDEDLFKLMIETNHGDEVISRGIVLPILAITDAGYTINLFLDESCEREGMIFSNGIFPLNVESKLFVADLAAFREWMYGVDWIDTKIPPGIYGTTVNGYCVRDENNHITDCGYDICLSSKKELPIASADMNISNQVMTD